MNKTLLSTTLLMSTLFSLQTIADVPNQVLLHYTGTVISQPCDISIGSTTTLDMGDVDIATLSTQGAITPWLNYQIHFSHCDVSTVISLGSAINGNTWGSASSKTFGVFDAQSKLLSNIGLQVFVNADKGEVNMYDTAENYAWLNIIPKQRESETATSYNLPIKFSFKNLNGVAPESGKITGVYTMAVEYN
ncbi:MULTISPECIES: fimbrial protein [Lelliottia]|uniref:Fimbrial-type adhesion domain-containing protein n=2 Tax=Lelliottia aquatilis TaxID=2080838 RepID=A0ABX5A353_9ENTR|nr:MULTISPECIES: fimbrial protein [Lelliottia]NTZ46213.1 type 1 fimbrial protein [Lelliottia aquatilis]POZ22824.1 hypothetical protein C3712_11735 [Lelliottia aquatilis]POZ25460.1 hypothetical protein C3708_12890 [Lelliottia sp. 7254-16]POZ26399.1 hypothetical protein C3711_12595 [Lelliottia aquatilis]POZ32387.1 hypothetical protein C3710_13115 [Lelliottia aquatilis]